MGMTMTQKILARHAGLDSVRAGQLIQARLDLVLGNDITTPVAINEFEAAGFSTVFDKSRIAMVMDHFTPNKDIKSATQCKQCRTFARRFDIDHFYDVGTHGHRTRPAAGEGPGRPRRGRHRRGLPHLHLRRPGRLLHRRGLHGHGRRHGRGRDLVQGALRHPGQPHRQAPALCFRQGRDPDTSSA